METFIKIKCLNCGYSLGSATLNSCKSTRTYPKCQKKFTVEVNHKTGKIRIKEIN